MRAAALWAVGGAVATGAMVWLVIHPPAKAPIPEHPPLMPAETKEGAAAPQSPEPPAETAPDAADALEGYERLLDVQTEMADFVQNADRLAAAERDRRARALSDRIDELEQRRIMLGAQAFYLRAALAQAQFSGDQAARDEAIAALQTRYAGAAPSTGHLDARYRRLKSREQEIVRDANARAFFPNGMTREEYLRAELDAALTEAYSADDE